MAAKLSVGLQKKLGLPGFSSIGASCHVEFEVETSLMESNLEGFQKKVHSAYSACQQAVNEQLARYQSTSTNLSDQSHSQLNGQTNPNPHQVRQESSRATRNQLRSIFAIARNQGLDPLQLVRKRFNLDQPEDLTIREASSLIDELKHGSVEVQV
jgi:hypothetical protein